MTEFTTPQPLQALLIDASQAPWLNEKDEAAASWDYASLPDRQAVAAWVRTWTEGDEIARVKAELATTRQTSAELQEQMDVLVRERDAKRSHADEADWKIKQLEFERDESVR